MERATMKEVEDVTEDLSKYFDDAVRDLGQESYREVLENFISDLQSRLDCVIEEMQAEGID